MKRSIGFHKLPVCWIRVCSWIFLVFLLMPLLLPQVIAGGNVAMLGMSFDWETSVVWVMSLETLLFAAGLTALAIVMRWKWAYDFGTAYASVSILVGALGLLANAGGVRDNFQSAVIQHVALAVFLVHLVRHRHEWRDQAANRPLQPTSGGRAKGGCDSIESAARG